ncbi:TPA: hypothetical protein VQN60_000747 [Streptococcus pneumoniae]|nr:hypothetical protein [Streptococcus pneumoniae]HET1253402.1 hypothetical protein [Streptococcus pneumoniae]
MKLLTKLKLRLEGIINEVSLDWRVVALDLSQSLIETQEKLQNANQRIADLENIVAIYKEKENSK